MLHIPEPNSIGENPEAYKQFFYDHHVKRWVHKTRAVADYVRTYKGEVSGSQMPEAAAELCREHGFNIGEQVEESNDESVENTEQVEAPAGVKGKRGRVSKYNYRGAEIGESFLVPREAITITASMIGTNKFIISAEGDGFRFERVA